MQATSLVIICSNENEEKSLIISRLYRCRRQFAVPKNDDQLKCYLKAHFTGQMKSRALHALAASSIDCEKYHYYNKNYSYLITVVFSLQIMCSGCFLWVPRYGKVFLCTTSGTKDNQDNGKDFKFLHHSNTWPRSYARYIDGLLDSTLTRSLLLDVSPWYCL